MKKVDYPKYLFVELTKNCNLHCIMCREKKLFFKNWFMSDEILNIVLKDIVPYVSVVDLRGWGESSLDPRLLNLVNQISNMKKRIVLYTNLNTQNPEYWKKLVKSKVLLAISIESGNEEGYKKIRRGGNLNIVRKNLLGIIDECNKDSSIPKPFFTTVISENNIDELDSLIEFAKECGIDKIELNPLSRKYEDNQPLGRWFGVLPQFKDEVDKKLYDLYIKAKENGIGIKIAATLYHENSLKDRKCIHPWDYCCICSDGDVSFCDHLFHNDKAIMGNLLKNSFDEIWNGKKYNELREKHNSRNLKCLAKEGLECEWCAKNRYGNLEYLLGNNIKAEKLNNYLGNITKK